MMDTITPPIITVAASKGGVGKTTLAYELAAALRGVLVDLDWDSGGASTMWGDQNFATRKRSVITQAFISSPETNLPIPRPLRGAPGRPDLVPADPRMAHVTKLDQMQTHQVAVRLTQWAQAWNRPVIIDTHPGTVAMADAAMAVANLIVVPLVLGAREVDAMHGFLAQRARSFPILIVPMKWRPTQEAQPLFRNAMEVITEHHIPIAPVIRRWDWLALRSLHTALVLSAFTPGTERWEAAEDFRRVAQAVIEYLNKNAAIPQVPAAGAVS